MNTSRFYNTLSNKYRGYLGSLTFLNRQCFGKTLGLTYYDDASSM